MIKTTVGIDGMMCSMCEAHISDLIRKTVPEAKKLAVSRKKREASFISDKAPDTERLRAAIAETGYACLSVTSEPYVKRGFFGRR